MYITIIIETVLFYVRRMLSALKKLTISGKHDEVGATPPGLQTMSRVLQNKFSKGVQYNSKKMLQRIYFILFIFTMYYRFL